MKKRYVVAIGAVFAALVVLTALFATFWVTAAGDKASLEDELTATESRLGRIESDLQAAQGRLGETEAVLGTTEGELETSRQETTTTREQLGQTQTQLETSEGELSATRSQLASVQSQVNAARSELATVQNQLAAGQTELANVQQAAQHCRDAGQGFVNAANAFSDVFVRWLADQATDAEVFAAAEQTDAAYNGFVANCSLQA